MQNNKNNSKKSQATRRRVSFFRQVNSIIKNEQNEYQPIENVDKVYHNKNNENIDESLRSWAVKHTITSRALNDLLIILISNGMNFLPHDSRSLLKTPKSISISNIADGKYWYNGIEKNLSRIFANLSSDSVIQLNFNVDGLPLYKSSKIEFYPILANIHGNILI